VDPGAAALDLVVVAISLAGLVASLDRVVKVFAGGGGKGVAGLAGRISMAHKVASGGNPRSSDQSMMAFVRHSLYEGIG
jgi:hypothetical protein